MQPRFAVRIVELRFDVLVEHARAAAAEPVHFLIEPDAGGARQIVLAALPETIVAMEKLSRHVRAVGFQRPLVDSLRIERRQLPAPVHGCHTAAFSAIGAGCSARPHRAIRSPSVDRLICSSAAARDLLPCVARSAQRMRLASNSRTRSSSEIGAGIRPGGGGTNVGTGAGCAANVSCSGVVGNCNGGSGVFMSLISVLTMRAGCFAAPKRIAADTQPMRTAPQPHVCAMRSQAFSSSRTLPGQL